MNEKDFKPDMAGVYGSNAHCKSYGKPTSCADCAHDRVSVVDGVYLLCQRKGGGKDDLSCYRRKELVQGGKVVAHVESYVDRRRNNKGRPPVSEKVHKGVRLEDIRREENLSLNTLYNRISRNPNISIEALRKPVRFKSHNKGNIHKGKKLEDIATETGISIHTLKSRIERKKDISLEELSAPLKCVGRRASKK